MFSPILIIKCNLFYKKTNLKWFDVRCPNWVLQTVTTNSYFNEIITGLTVECFLRMYEY